MNDDRHKARSAQARLSKTSFMNDTKWYEFFYLIATRKIGVQKLLFKFLTGEHIFSYPVPDLEGFDKLGFRDGSHPGPFKYNEIEYIEIPKQIVVARKNREETLAPHIMLQDIEIINELCNKMGQLKVEYTVGEKIRIYGYQ